MKKFDYAADGHLVVCPRNASGMDGMLSTSYVVAGRSSSNRWPRRPLLPLSRRPSPPPGETPPLPPERPPLLKEAVADDTANNNTSITSRVSQTTQIDDQIRSTDSHERKCEKEYLSDHRADTGTLWWTLDSDGACE